MLYWGALCGRVGVSRSPVPIIWISEKTNSDFCSAYGVCDPATPRWWDPILLQRCVDVVSGDDSTQMVTGAALGEIPSAKSKALTS